ncbi:hypothetical protein GCM10008983_28160 [Lentibacillus halophilus]|uniref:YrhK-like protein n=1 Tax=Lentibacillus halophilus TaxID=295065 RepID=A0ABN0ZIB9_9BACI
MGENSGKALYIIGEGILFGFGDLFTVISMMFHIDNISWFVALITMYYFLKILVLALTSKIKKVAALLK